ncbi:hypothetical protein DSUL_50253 [Desulfovibrionales bacterium]
MRRVTSDFIVVAYVDLLPASERLVRSFNSGRYVLSICLTR